MPAFTSPLAARHQINELQNPHDPLTELLTPRTLLLKYNSTVWIQFPFVAVSYQIIRSRANSQTTWSRCPSQTTWDSSLPSKIGLSAIKDRPTCVEWTLRPCEVLPRCSTHQFSAHLSGVVWTKYVPWRRFVNWRANKECMYRGR